MKATVGKVKVSGKAAPSVIMEEIQSLDEMDRLDRIATAAYYKAEARGFTPGLDMEDWLEAEAEFDERALS